MSLTINQVEIGSYVFEVNPRVEDISLQLKQSVSEAIDGTTLVSYIPEPGDTSKILDKRTFKIDGIDPGDLVANQIEAIKDEIKSTPPINFKNALGETFDVVVISDLTYTLDADQYHVREYSLTVREV